jgi:hypothetical protein
MTFWKMQNCKGKKKDLGGHGVEGRDQKRKMTTKKDRGLSEVMEMFYVCTKEDAFYSKHKLYS